jgi:hypothetical protein
VRKALVLLAMALPCAIFGQNSDPAVSISGGPPAKGWTVLYAYTTITSADYVEYICSARSDQPNLSASVTQIVDSANTATVTTSAAHGLAVNNRVAIAGVTGDTDLNATYTILTVPSSTTFTVTSANVTDTTYNNTGITASSNAPRSNQPIWAIKRFTYGGTGGTSLLAVQWAVTGSNTKSGTGQANACDSRTTLAYQ